MFEFDSKRKYEIRLVLEPNDVNKKNNRTIRRWKHSDMNDYTNLLTLEEIEGSNPFEGSTNSKQVLSWENLSVSINEAKKSLWSKVWCKISGEIQSLPRELLKNVSGYAETGQLVAIMGPSGAGKTTLLASLAGLIETASGSICLNGVELSKRVMSNIASFVPQFDPLPSMLTISEYITFSCALKLDKCTDAREKRILTIKVIEELGLTDSRDILISRISGGEKKRVSIASEIITRPRILFLDEPTTGLDSSSAFRVIQSIKIAAGDSIVLCSIHQPGITLYNLFTDVVFLTEGRTAFFGSLNDAKCFFEREGYTCPNGFDETEYYIKIISSRHSYEDEVVNLEESRAMEICEAYMNSSYSEFTERIQRKHDRVEVESNAEGARWLTQFNWLVWRIYVENTRTIIDGLIAFQYYAISIVLIGIFYIGTDSQSQSGVKDVMGILYLTSCELVYSCAYTVLDGMRRDIPIYVRERGFYGASAYYLAMVFSWIPRVMMKALFLTILLSIILKYNENSFFIFLQYFSITIGCCICSAAYGIMISSHIENTDVASTIMVPIDLLSILMAGIFYNLRTPPWYIGILKYLSIFHYAHELLSIVHFTKIHHLKCDVKDLPCFQSGAEVLAEYGYGQNDLWTHIVGLSVLTIFLCFIGFLGTRKRRIVKSVY